MKGSVHEDDFFIGHDALVLITAKETIEWMKDQNYFHRWLLPMNGLQDGTPYAGRPVGNIPDFMPLDNSLNRDILDNPRRRRGSHSQFPYTLQSSGDFLWCRETEAHIPLLLVCSLPV